MDIKNFFKKLVFRVFRGLVDDKFQLDSFYRKYDLNSDEQENSSLVKDHRWAIATGSVASHCQQRSELNTQTFSELQLQLQLP